MTKDPARKVWKVNHTNSSRTISFTHSILFHLGSLTHHLTGNQHQHCPPIQQHNHPPQNRNPHRMRLLRTRGPRHRLCRSIDINNISPKNSSSNTPNIHTPHMASVSPSSLSQPISVVVPPNPTVTPRSRLLMAAIQILPGDFRCRRRV